MLLLLLLLLLILLLVPLLVSLFGRHQLCQRQFEPSMRVVG